MGNCRHHHNHRQRGHHPHHPRGPQQQPPVQQPPVQQPSIQPAPQPSVVKQEAPQVPQLQLTPSTFRPEQKVSPNECNRGAKLTPTQAGIAQSLGGSLVAVKGLGGSGIGCVIGQSGDRVLILTVYHCLPVNSVAITDQDFGPLQPRVLASDKALDYALLEVCLPVVKPLPLISFSAKRDLPQQVYLLHPSTSESHFWNTAPAITSTDHENGYFYHCFSTEPGLSGSPIFDTDFRLVGIHLGAPEEKEFNAGRHTRAIQDHVLGLDPKLLRHLGDMLGPRIENAWPSPYLYFPESAANNLLFFATDRDITSLTKLKGNKVTYGWVPYIEGNRQGLQVKDLKKLLLEGEGWNEILTHAKAWGERDVLVYIHGFANSFDDALTSLDAIKTLLGPWAHTLMAYSWPSAGQLFSYNKDKEMVDASTQHLLTFLLDGIAAQKRRGAKLHIMAHSMGCYLLLKTLVLMANMRPSDGLGQVYLIAADVPVLHFEANYLPAATQLTETLVSVSCKSDQALMVSAHLNKDARVGQAPLGIHGILEMEIPPGEQSYASLPYHGYHTSQWLASLLKENLL